MANQSRVPALEFRFEILRGLRAEGMSPGFCSFWCRVTELVSQWPHMLGKARAVQKQGMHSWVERRELSCAEFKPVELHRGRTL